MSPKRKFASVKNLKADVLAVSISSEPDFGERLLAISFCRNLCYLETFTLKIRLSSNRGAI